MSPRLKIGDVFLVPLDEIRVGVGQIVAKYLSAYYLATFERVFERDATDVDEALRSPVVFLALSLDAKLALGHWPILANVQVSEHIPLPAFKEAFGSPDRIDVVDFSGTLRRSATDAEASAVRNRTVIAPVVLEKAMRARLGLEPWLEHYDHLVPDLMHTTDRLFE